MVVELRKIADVRMGYSFRTRLDQAAAGKIAVIQMKDLSKEDRVDCGGLVRVDLARLKDRHLVCPGDLVFRSRGQVNTAALLVDDPGEAVVAAPLLRVRVACHEVTPAYLCWYINQPLAQASLARRAKGTAQQMISKQALEELEVALPSLDQQRAIVELAELAKLEQNLMKRIAEKRQHYLSAMLMEWIRRD